MGNSMGGKRRAKVMKIDGSTAKVKPPATAGDVLLEHPGYDLLESEQVKNLGVRAKPLDHDLPLKPGKLYFLVELPKLERRPAAARRVQSAINVSAKDRLESLMLARRSASDVSFARPPGDGGGGGGGASVRVRMRLPRAEVARLLEETSDRAEVAKRIMELGAGSGQSENGAAAGGPPAPGKAVNVTAGDKKEKRTRFSLTEEHKIR